MTDRRGNGSSTNIRRMIIAAAMIWLGSLQVPCGAEEIILRLNPDEVRQEIDGFGASGAWWAQIVGGWEESERERIVELLFGKEGIALSIYRYNLGAGSGEEIGDPWRRAETFETADREIMPIKRLWATGNFSRFVRPGYRRFEIGQDSATLRAVGCMSPDGARLVVVVMNPGSESQQAELRFASGGAVNTLAAYETSRANDLKALNRGAKDKKYSFPAESVTTLIIEGSNIKTLAGDATYTSDDRAVLAEFSAKAYDSDAIKAMKIH